jgi:hypothetical protein
MLAGGIEGAIVEGRDRIAQTTRLAPRTMSPAANTPSMLVIIER